MSQSLVKINTHIIFSTKHRNPCITPRMSEDLFGYLASACRYFGCYVFAVGGYLNHIHIVISLSKNTVLANLVRDIKIASSMWIKSNSYEYNKMFQWQSGYAAFSVSEASLNGLAVYVREQELHHKKQSFEEEYETFLKEYNVQYDKKYFID